MANPISDIADAKVGKISLVDGAAIAAAKLGSEWIMAKVPFIGNGTLKSGFIKVGAALVMSMAGDMRGPVGKAAQYISTGVLIDGMEDLVLGAKNRYFGQSMQTAGASQAAFA